jgi:hypothetical protein
MDGMRFSPQFMMIDVFVEGNCAKEAGSADKASFAREFPILGFLLNMGDILHGSFWQRIEPRSGSGQNALSQCAAVTAII